VAGDKEGAREVLEELRRAAASVRQKAETLVTRTMEKENEP
jgi:hypothetical protein